MDSRQTLIVLDLALFAAVLASLAFGWAGEPPGLAIIFAWIIVFLATIVSFTSHLAEGAEGWYQYGMAITMGILIAMVFALLLSMDVYGALLLMPFAVMGMFVYNWLFVDRSEEEFEKDLERLKGEFESKNAGAGAGLKARRA